MSSQKPFIPEKHLPILEQVFEEGFGVAEFCARCNISEPLFYVWVKKHPEFQEAYDLALIKGRAMWEKYPMHVDNKSFSFPYWSLIYAVRYKQAGPKLQRLKDKSPTAKMKVAWKALTDGVITSQAFNQIASGIMTEVKIQEVDNQAKILKNEKASSELTDEFIQNFMLLKSGKAKIVPSDD